MSDLSVPEIGGAAMLVILVLDRVFAFIKGFSRKHNGAAGEMNVNWWTQKFREIMEDVMERRNRTIRDIIREELDKRGPALRQIVHEEMDRYIAARRSGR